MAGLAFGLAVVLLLVTAAPSPAPVAPRNCGTMTVKNARYSCKNDGSSTALKFRCRKGQRVFFAIRRSLDVDPADGSYLLTTNRGFFRIDPETDEVTRVRGTISAGNRSSTVGTFLEILVTGSGQLLGSGHPTRSAGCRRIWA